MSRIRTIRRYEGAAVSVGVGLVLLLAALAWGRLAPPRAVPDDDPELAAMGTACSEQLHRDARTTSTPPDPAKWREHAAGARSASLRNDPCTRFYRRKLALDR